MLYRPSENGTWKAYFHGFLEVKAGRSLGPHRALGKAEAPTEGDGAVSRVDTLCEIESKLFDMELSFSMIARREAKASRPGEGAEEGPGRGLSGGGGAEVEDLGVSE